MGLIKHSDSVSNEVFRTADGTSELTLDDHPAVHLVESRNEPAVLMLIRAAQQINELDVHRVTRVRSGVTRERYAALPRLLSPAASARTLPPVRRRQGSASRSATGTPNRRSQCPDGPTAPYRLTTARSATLGRRSPGGRREERSAWP